MTRRLAVPDDGRTALPRARARDLLVRRIGDEVIVYDLERHRAHCLPAVTAALWRRCDGRTSVPEIARALADESGTAVDEGAVWVGLHRLARKHLLDSRLPPLPSRRDWLRSATVLGITLLTLRVPTAAEAASALSNAACAARPPANCGGAPCSQNPGNTCRRSGAACSCTQN